MAAIMKVVWMDCCPFLHLEFWLGRCHLLQLLEESYSVESPPHQFSRSSEKESHSPNILFEVYSRYVNCRQHSVNRNQSLHDYIDIDVILDPCVEI